MLQKKVSASSESIESKGKAKPHVPSVRTMSRFSSCFTASGCNPPLSAAIGDMQGLESISKHACRLPNSLFDTNCGVRCGPRFLSKDEQRRKRG